MADVSGGKVGLNVVPDFGSFSSLFSNGIRGALTTAQTEGKKIADALGGGLKTGVIVATAAAGIAIGDFVLKGVQQYTQLADTTRTLDAITGASAQRSSLFAGVLKEVGVSADSAARPLGILAKNIQNHTALFDKYGVAIAKTKDGQTDLFGTLDNLRQLFNSSADATVKDAAAKELLGRGFQTLIPYLELSNTQLKEFQDIARRSGDVITQSDVDNARQLAVNIEQAKEHIQSLQIAAGRAGASGVNDFFSGLNVLSKTGVGDIPRVLANLTGLGQLLGIDLPNHIRQAVSSEDDLARKHAELVLATQEAGVATDSLGKAIEGLNSAEEGVQSAEQGVQKAAEGITKAEQNVQKAYEGVTKAQEGVQKAHEATQKAIESETKAQQALADLLVKGPVDANAVTSAQQALESADRGVTDSTEQLAQAEQNLAQIQQFEAVDAANELTAAHLQLAQTTLQLTQAKFQASRAVPTLNDPFAQQQAQLQVQQATLAQANARENLTKITDFGTQADTNAANAQKQVRDAAQRVTDALDSQADAQTKLNTALLGDPQFEQKVADAKQAVADAALGVRDAQQGERDATLAVRDANQAVVDANQGVLDAKQSQTDAEQKLSDAKIKVRDATDAVNQIIDDEAAKGVNLAGVLDTLKQKYPELAGIIDQFYAQVSASRAQFAATQPTTAPPPPSGPPPGTDTRPAAQQAQSPPSSYNIQRAGGGGVVPGQTYLINERGYETVTFPAAGEVHPANLTPVGGANVTVNIAGTWDLSSPAERQRIADLMAREIRAALSKDRNSFAGRQ